MATTQSKKGSVVGCYSVQAWLAGSDGYAYGTAGESLAQALESSALLLRYPQSAQVPAPARVVTNLTGGNRWLGQVMFGLNEVGSFPLVLEDLDAEFHALCGASTMDVTENSRWRQFADNINLPDLPQMGLMISTIFQSREDGSDGVNLYVNYIIPRCQIQPTFPQMAYQAEGPVTYTVSPTMANIKPTGAALTGLGLRDSKTVMYAVVTPNPLALTTYIADGIETTFTTGYRPISTVITAGNTPNQMVKNGTPTALTSIVTTTGLATLTGAGSAGDKIVLLYETAFQTI